MPSEHSEQAAVVDWLRLQGILFASIPNGFPLIGMSKKRRAQIVNHMKAEGMTPGMPDLFIFEPRIDGDRLWHGCALEMKRADGGELSDKQVEILAELERRGYYTIVAHGADEALELLEMYLSFRRK